VILQFKSLNITEWGHTFACGQPLWPSECGTFAAW